jgi:hypothetical protein
MTTAIQIMVVVGMVAFAMYTIGKIIYWLCNEIDDFEDVRSPETFNLPTMLHEIEEEEKAATRSNG